MKRSKICTLDNGLRIIFYQDTSKHTVTANVYTLFGGAYKEFKYDGQYYRVESGIAHFLEHTLIDNSFEGNIYKVFASNSIRFNGFTGSFQTRFFIDTVHDFEENLVRLIKMVNVPKFTEQNIEDSKKPIIEEIKKVKDNKFRNFNRVARSSLFHNQDLVVTIGEPDEIANLKYETVKLVYDAFYQPSNQIITVSGNFDMKAILELIKKTYDEVKRDYKTLEKLDYNEDKTVNKEYAETKEITSDEYVEMDFKVDISHLSPYEKVKFSFYLNYFLQYNFNESSDVYKYMTDKKLTTYGLEHFLDFVDKYCVIVVGCYTDKIDEFKTLVLNIINNRVSDEEDFYLRRNHSIIDLIMREDNHNHVMGAFYDNIINFGYEEMDKIEDLEAYTFSDYKMMLESLDFSNYTVTRMLKETE